MPAAQYDDSDEDAEVTAEGLEEQNDDAADGAEELVGREHRGRGWPRTLYGCRCQLQGQQVHSSTAGQKVLAKPKVPICKCSWPKLLCEEMTRAT